MSPSVEMLGVIGSNRKSLSQLPISNIILVGSSRQKREFTRWLNDIALVFKGYKYFASDSEFWSYFNY
jgi:hypothetical protein